MKDELDQLLAVVGTDEFERNGRMRVVSVRWSGDGVTIRLHVDHGTKDKSSWHFRLASVLGYHFAGVGDCGLNVWRGEHPAIDQYLQRREYLHFDSAPADPYRAVGKLWAAHVALVDDWIAFDRYLNADLPLADLLARGSGPLATGPQFLIAAYAEVLESEGCRPTRATLPIQHSITTALMVHFGESFVVAQELFVKRIADHV